MRFIRLAVLCGLCLQTMPSAAQTVDPVRTERRVDRLESEMRAVQRKVFPGGDARYFEPEITAPAAAAATPDGVPATTPITDLTARLGEMERQLRTLTGQVEANEFKLRQMETSLTRMQGDVEFRLTRLEGGAPPPAEGAGAVPEVPLGGVAVVPGARPGSVVPPVGSTALPATAPPVAEPAAPPAPPRAATAVAAWQAAYALALAKDWPGTETAMAAYLTDWPKSTRLPQAQYWLGRSFAERKRHAEAADAYLKVYNNYPRSDRAADALLGLAEAMIGIKDTQQSCRVLAELDSVYGAKLPATKVAEAKALRTKAKCKA